MAFATSRISDVIWLVIPLENSLRYSATSVADTESLRSSSALMKNIYFIFEYILCLPNADFLKLESKQIHLQYLTKLAEPSKVILVTKIVYIALTLYLFIIVGYKNNM